MGYGRHSERHLKHRSGGKVVTDATTVLVTSLSHLFPPLQAVATRKDLDSSVSEQIIGHQNWESQIVLLCIVPLSR